MDYRYTCQEEAYRRRIANLEDSVRQLENQVANLRSKEAEAVRNLRALHKALDKVNPYSSFIPPKEMHQESSFFKYNPLNLWFCEPVRMSLAADPNAPYPVSQDTVEVRAIPIYEIVAEIDRNPRLYQTHVHLLARSSRDLYRMSYCINHETLEDLQHFPDAKGKLILQVAGDLVEGLSNAARGG